MQFPFIIISVYEKFITKQSLSLQRAMQFSFRIISIHKPGLTRLEHNMENFQWNDSLYDRIRHR